MAKDKKSAHEAEKFRRKIRFDKLKDEAENPALLHSRQALKALVERNYVVCAELIQLAIDELEKN